MAPTLTAVPPVTETGPMTPQTLTLTALAERVAALEAVVDALAERVAPSTAHPAHPADRRRAALAAVDADYRTERAARPAPTAERGPFYGTADVARILGTSPATVRRMIAAGDLPGAVRIGPAGSGAVWRIPAAALTVLPAVVPGDLR